MKLTTEHGDVVSTESLEAEIERRIRLAIEPLFSALELGHAASSSLRNPMQLGQRPSHVIGSYSSTHSHAGCLGS